MRIQRLAVLSLAVVSTPTVGSIAFAFGGTARELERQGTFAVTNNAGFGLSQQLNSPQNTSFMVRPALDYFVVPNLSVGGAFEFDYFSSQANRFSVAPEVGYELALSDTWSFWPQLALRMDFSSASTPFAALTIFAPFLVHPAEHFFFGIGPGVQQGFTSNPSTFITGDFRIGGYFDH